MLPLFAANFTPEPAGIDAQLLPAQHRWRIAAAGTASLAH
jgi:hypothetical protein